jgi:hypothetical protein
MSSMVVGLGRVLKQFSFRKVWPECSTHSQLPVLVLRIDRNLKHSALVKVIARPNIQLVQEGFRAANRANRFHLGTLP